MLCPFCREKDTSVVDSRPTEDGTAIRRRRLCGCDRKERFTTFERVQFQELTVIKGNGKREPFDREKISKSVRIATRKRPIDSEAIENFRVNYAGKKGILNELFAAFRTVPNEEKKAYGQELNTLKTAVAEKVKSLQSQLKSSGKNHY